MQPMRFLVSRTAYNAGVINPVVCIIRGVKASQDSSMYDEVIKNLTARVGKIWDDAQNSAEIQGFRKLYANIGHKTTPAGERLVETVKKKGALARYGNLVDAYNIVALETVSPFGMHDAQVLLNSGKPLVFRRAHGNEELIPAFSKKDKAEKIPKGDFVYGIEEDRFIPFAWLGKKDVDSRDFQLSDTTTSLLFTAIGNEVTSQERNRELCEQVFKEIKKSCPDATLEIVNAEFYDEATSSSTVTTQEARETVNAEAAK